MGIAFVGMPHVDVDKAVKAILDNLPEAPLLPSLQNLYPEIYFTNYNFRDARGMPCLRINEATGKLFFDTSSPSVAEELAEFYQSYMDNDLARSGLHLETAHGQLAMLRRLYGSPVPPENFIVADIDSRNLGPDQPDPVSPDEVWEEPGIE